MSWTIDTADRARAYHTGYFGFTIYGLNGVLADRKPVSTSLPGYVDVVGEITKIEFKTFNNIGIHLMIKLVKDGKDQPFVCIDCLPNSPSLALGRLYLDGEMNQPMGLPGAANCHHQCEFIPGKVFWS